MASLRLEIITAERIVLTEEMVESVRVPGADGVVGILPRHAPLMTALAPGELIMRKGEEEESFFVTGGFLEVRDNQIAVLADASERAEEIDIARAEEARLALKKPSARRETERSLRPPRRPCVAH